MPATIAVGPFRATIADYRWTSETPELEELLNAMLPASGPSGSDPAPDLTAATFAAEKLGGRVVSAGEVEPPVEGRVY